MTKLIEALTTELQGYKDILDLGVGTGRFAEPLQKAGYRVVGVDISKRMINKAMEKGVKNLLLADARRIPFRDKAFDVTISIHLLHLISEWRTTLEEIRRVSRYAMFSLYYARKNPVREAYNNLLKQYGYERSRPGKSEQDLRESVTPTKSLFVASYYTNADERILNLQQRTSSSQWEIPEHVNLKAVEQLKTQFAGKTFRQNLHLSVWETDSLGI